MPLPLLALAGIAAGSSLAAGAGQAIASSISQRNANEANLQAIRETNQANLEMQRSANMSNMELARYANAQEYNLWREQIAEQRANEAMIREYNSPLQQMQRYREAGLNPNLIYGNAQGATASATPTPSAPSVHRATVEASRAIPGQIQPIQYGGISESVISALNLFKDIMYRDAQIDNLKSQTQANDAKSQNLYANTLLAGAKRLGLEQSTAFAKIMQPFQQSALEANIDLKRRQIDNISSTIANRDFMQKVTTEKLQQTWTFANISQRRNMIESAKVALTDRLVQLKENRQAFERNSGLWWAEYKRVGHQVKVLRQLQTLRPEQLKIAKGNMYINAAKVAFGIGQGLASGLGAFGGRLK